MNQLTKVEQVSATMQELQKEMCRAGVIEEMVDDAMSALDGDDDEEAADAEVEQVMAELAAGAMGGAQAAPTKAPAMQQEEAAAEEAAEEEDEMAGLRARLGDLKG